MPNNNDSRSNNEKLGMYVNPLASTNPGTDYSSEVRFEEINNDAIPTLNSELKRLEAMEDETSRKELSDSIIAMIRGQVKKRTSETNLQLALSTGNHTLFQTILGAEEKSREKKITEQEAQGMLLSLLDHKQHTADTAKIMDALLKRGADADTEINVGGAYITKLNPLRKIMSDRTAIPETVEVLLKHGATIDNTYDAQLATQGESASTLQLALINCPQLLIMKTQLKYLIFCFNEAHA